MLMTKNSHRHKQLNMLMTKTEWRPHQRARLARELLELRRCLGTRLRGNLRSHHHNRTWNIFWQFWPKHPNNYHTHASLPSIFHSVHIFAYSGSFVDTGPTTSTWSLGSNSVKMKKWISTTEEVTEQLGSNSVKMKMINNNKWRCQRPWGLGAAKVEEISAATEKILLQSIALSLDETSEKQI